MGSGRQTGKGNALDGDILFYLAGDELEFVEDFFFDKEDLAFGTAEADVTDKTQAAFGGGLVDRGDGLTVFFF